MGTVSDNLSQNLGGSLNIRASGGDGNIVTFASKDSKLAQYIDITSKGVKLNCKVDGEWGNTINLATKDDFVIKTYTIAGKAVNAETTADFEPNIALSGYTPLGIVGTRLNSYGSVTLVYADLVDNTKARVRVRNNGTASVTGENVIIRVLYFKS